MNDSTDRQAATPFGDALGQMTEGFTVPPWKLGDCRWSRKPSTAPAYAAWKLTACWRCLQLSAVTLPLFLGAEELGSVDSPCAS